MRRILTVALGLMAALAAAGEARAQFGYGYYPYGYGGYGWGGWGGTVQGNVARGLGYYAMGAGVYNEDTAVANAINLDTLIRWNQYLYLSQLEANRYERQRIARQQARDSAAGEAVYERIRDKPTPDDIANGDALNVALDQLTDPKVHSSALRLATNKVPGRVVRDIPFVKASEAITISLDKLTAEDGWPAALRGPKFADERKAYSEAIDKSLEEDRDGEISPETLARVRSSLDQLKAKLEANRPTDRAEFGEAEGYLKTLYGMTRLLERPEVEKIVAELENIKETSLGSLLSFMHTFNLRFGKATTPAQRAAYEALYPMIASHRDRVLKASEDASAEKSTAKASDSTNDRPTDFFQGMKLEHLEGKRNADTKKSDR